MPLTTEAQLEILSWDASRLLAVIPAYSPVRKEIKTISTARGTRAGSAGDEAIAAAAKRPVPSPTAHMFCALVE